MLPDDHLIYYTDEEELANRITHGLAALAALAGLVLLVTEAALTGDPYRIVSSAVFGGSLLLFYVVSTLYHSLRRPHLRHIFRILDHIAIFLVIAGSYTPFTLVTLREGSGWYLFGAVWALAAAGAVFKAFMTHRLAFLAPVFYIAMGWLVVVDLEGLLSSLATGGVRWLVAGGLFYTVGILFYAIEKIPFNHAIWHLFVIAGSVCHYLAVARYVVPMGG